MRARRTLRAAALAAGVPEDALCGGARVTLIAGSSALVEGQRGVVELSGERIRLRTAQGIITVSGRSLCLRELSLDAALITGSPVQGVSCGM